MSARRPLLFAVAALGACPALALGHGGEAHAGAEWYTRWNPSPLQVGPLLLITVVYLLGVRRTRGRVGGWRVTSFLAGVGVAIFALVSPIDAVGEESLLWVHMLQHMLLGDLAPLLIVLGLSGPLLRPLLAAAWVQRLRVLVHPAVAFTVWAVTLLGWHVPAAYELAVRNEIAHFAEHASFFTAGALVWASLMETLPGPEWFGTGPKIAFVGGVRTLDTILGNIFWFSGTPLYPIYADDTAAFGMSPLEDQAMAGTVMMSYTGAVTLILLGVLFFRMAREGEIRQRLVEGGVEAGAARRAVRYGRGEDLARRHGVELPSAAMRAPGIS